MLVLTLLDLVDLGKLLLSVGIDELLDDHETAADTNDQLTVQNLGIDLTCTENVVAIAQLLNGYRTISLVNVLSDHLIEQIALRK